MYHPEYDKPENYLNASKNQKDHEIKLLLEKAAATIAYLKYQKATRLMLMEMANII